MPRFPEQKLPALPDEFKDHRWVFMVQVPPWDLDTRNRLSTKLEQKGYDNIDSSGSRFLIDATGKDLTVFLNDLFASALTINDLRRVLYMPDPGLGIILDFPEDEPVGSQVYASMPESMHPFRPSRLVNFVDYMVDKESSDNEE